VNCGRSRRRGQRRARAADRDHWRVLGIRCGVRYPDPRASCSPLLCSCSSWGAEADAQGKIPLWATREDSSQLVAEITGIPSAVPLDDPIVGIEYRALSYFIK
jgi:hypothetical protein